MQPSIPASAVLPSRSVRSAPRALLCAASAAPPGLAIGLSLIAALALAGVLAPFLAPHDPYVQNLSMRLAAPGPDYPLGADSLGRCVLSRVLYGIRPTLGLSLAVSLGMAGIGTALGLVCPFSRLLDGLIMRLTDAFFAFPGLILSLVIIGVAGQSMAGLALALILPGWPKYARVARTVAVSTCAEGHVEATRALGAGRKYIVRACLLPRVLPCVGSIFTIGIGGKIVQIAGLGVLGLGVAPPTPEWGGMLVKGLPVLAIAPHIALASGGAIALASLAFTLAGEGLARLLDPARDEGLIP
ncbi:MAG: ABC transporter permease [Pseudodesulfovibrio sp.]